MPVPKCQSGVNGPAARLAVLLQPRIRRSNVLFCMPIVGFCYTVQKTPAQVHKCTSAQARIQPRSGRGQFFGPVAPLSPGDHNAYLGHAQISVQCRKAAGRGRTGPSCRAFEPCRTGWPAGKGRARRPLATHETRSIIAGQAHARTLLGSSGRVTGLREAARTMGPRAGTAVLLYCQDGRLLADQ